MTKLTPKQQLWVKEYLKDLNATAAAVRAGYSKKTAKQIATENLAKPVLMEAISKEMAKRAEETEIDAAWVLRELKARYQDCIDQNEVGLAFKGLDLIGKHTDVQSYLEKKQVEVSGNLKINYLPPKKK